MAGGYLPDTDRRWDLEEKAPEAVIARCAEVVRIHGVGSMVAAYEARQMATRSTATVRFLLREEPADPVAAAAWKNCLALWISARRCARRLQAACTPPATERPLGLRKAA